MIVHDQFHHLWDAKTFLGFTRRFHLDSRKECSNGLDMRHILSCRKAEMFTPMLKGHKGRCFHLTKKISIVQLETVDVKVQILYQPCESLGLLPKKKYHDRIKTYRLWRLCTKRSIYTGRNGWFSCDVYYSRWIQQSWAWKRWKPFGVEIEKHSGATIFVASKETIASGLGLAEIHLYMFFFWEVGLNTM